MEREKLLELVEKAKLYEKVSSEELVKVFKENHIYFPDFVDKFLLMNFFKKYVFDEDVYATYSDEFKYRLKNYDTAFSVYLIEETDKEYNYSLHPYEYKNLFMRFFFLNKNKFKTTIALEKALTKLEGSNSGSQENYEKLRFHFREIFYTPKGYLDGIALSALKDAVAQSYTLNQVKGLGEKYEVQVPRRMNKQQLIDLLAARFRLTEEEKATLQPKPILALTQYAKEKGFKISTDLKKEDMIEFIVFSLNKYNEDVEKDLYNYDILLPEEIIEEPVDEEEAPEVQEEPVVEAIPTSNEYVEQEAPQEEPVEEEAEPEEEEEPQPEPEPEEEPQPEEEEEKEEEEPKQEVVPQEEPEEEEEEPEYDESIDNEIRDIIKDYYAKKSKKDRALRVVILIIFLLLVGGLAFFALKFFGVI